MRASRPAGSEAPISRLRLPRLRKKRMIFIQMLPEKRGADLRSLGPTHVCSCGCSVFSTMVQFDNYELAWWYLEGECVNCSNKVTLPCPVDKPEEV